MAKSVLTFLLLVAPMLMAQESRLNLGYASMDTDGEATLFANHFGLEDGLFLEDFSLNLAVKSVDLFRFQAQGFGAEPYQRAGLRIERKGTIRFNLDYSKREHFFSSSVYNLGGSNGDWAITRWKGSFLYDGFEAVRLKLRANSKKRDGLLSRPFFGLGESYVADHTLDESWQEYGLMLETRTLPVHLTVEQLASSLKRTWRSVPGNDGQALGREDEDILTQINSPGQDKVTSPATRVSLDWHNNRVEVTAFGFWRQDRLKTRRDESQTYGLVGGQVGHVAFRNELDGKGDGDTEITKLAMAFKLTPRVTFKLAGMSRDRSIDTRLDGLAMVDLIGRESTITLEEDISNLGTLDRTETDLAAEAIYSHGSIRLRAGFRDERRKLSWQQSVDAGTYSETRDADGWNLNARFRPNRAFSAWLGWDKGTFSKKIFRTDPRSSDRYQAKVRWRARSGQLEGLSCTLQSSREEADNRDDEVNLKRVVRNSGLTLAYQNKLGSYVSLWLNRIDLESDVSTLFYAPQLQTGASRYDSDLLQLGARGSFSLSERARLIAGFSRFEDRGDSYPLDLNQSDVRFEMDAPGSFQWALFLQNWSYNNPVDTLTYDVERYGFSLGRRF